MDEEVSIEVKKTRYIPTLDGWRAVAILLVIFFHAQLQGFDHLGAFGVYLFFSISGLLICGRLLDEERLTGKLDLKGFYIKRSFRILPVAFVYLAAVSLLMYFYVLPRCAIGVVAAIGFIRNFFHIPIAAGYPTSHFWSLSVEEQFYFILPMFLLKMKRHRVKILLFCCVVSLGFAIRTFLRHHFWGNEDTQDCIYLLLLPSAVAIALKGENFRSAATKFLLPAIIVPLGFLFAYLSPPGFPPQVVFVISMLLSTTLHEKSFISRILELRPLRFVGRISFSLYLWQQLFFAQNFLKGSRPLGIFNTFPFYFIGLVGLATISYYAVEKPINAFGHRLARSTTA